MLTEKERTELEALRDRYEPMDHELNMLRLERIEKIVEIYQRGQCSLRELARASGVSHVTIGKILEQRGLREHIDQDAPGRGDWFG